MNVRYLYTSLNPEAFPEAFDEYDDKHISSVAPHGLGSEIQGLLLLRRELNLLSPEEQLKHLTHGVDELYRACKQKWREDL